MEDTNKSVEKIIPKVRDLTEPLREDIKNFRINKDKCMHNIAIAFDFIIKEVNLTKELIFHERIKSLNEKYLEIQQAYFDVVDIQLRINAALSISPKEPDQRRGWLDEMQYLNNCHNIVSDSLSKLFQSISDRRNKKMITIAVWTLIVASIGVIFTVMLGATKCG